MKLPVHSLWLLPLLAATVLRHPEDRELGRRLKSRDATVVGELYDRYGRIAFTLILKNRSRPGRGGRSGPGVLSSRL